MLGKRLAMALLIDLQLTSPIRLCTCAVDISYGGNTYTGGRGVGVDTVKDQGGEIQSLRFSLSGVPSEYISLALAEPIQGKIVVVYTALMDPDTHALVDVLPLWRGTLDQMPIKHGPTTSIISVTAEHRGIAFSRPKGLRYTDAEQRRIYPSRAPIGGVGPTAPADKCLEYLVSQSTHQDVWPSAAFFKR